MKATVSKGRWQTVVLLVALLSVLTIPATSPVMRALEGVQGCAQQIPQWIRDRQQYETSYVYRPAMAMTARVPQWVIDRQQYETNYVYIPCSSTTQPPRRVTSIPQWAIDRQQYETNYVYAPPAGVLLARASRGAKLLVQ